MVHDFKRFPELTDSQMDLYYFSSPHKQIFADFQAKVVKVVDGDTIRVSCNFRDFDFPIRFMGVNSPEMSEGGEESKNWLMDKIQDAEIDILIDAKNRVGKYGRLLGTIIHKGMNINEESMRAGHSTSFENRMEGKLPNLNKDLAVERWF